MAGGRLGDLGDLGEELIKKACSLAFKAHKSPGKPYLQKISTSSEAVFAFPGSWDVNDWFHHRPFGEIKINSALFPSLRSIGNNEAALVNEAFMRRFEAVLQTTSLEKEVKKAVKEKNRTVFTGHSLGGPMAILATLWFLEKHVRPDSSQVPPLCMTFGSPLIGDKILTHAVRRENWVRYFFHFVMRYDIIPRTMLAPLTSMEQDFPRILLSLDPKEQSSNITEREAALLFMAVMRNASSVASHCACKLMECTNPLLQTITSFIEFSPYRPFGTYIFCTGNGKLVTVTNPDAVLQLIFYCAQLTSEAELADVAFKSLQHHLVYENEVKESLEMQNVVHLDDHLENLPLSSNDNTHAETATVNAALNDLGLNTRARLCLCAAAALEKKKQENQKRIDSNKRDIIEKLSSTQEYQTASEARKVGYYDAFKMQNDTKDFHTNVRRLELVGLWDEIIDMLKRYELPDGFEGQKEWIDLGTKFRRLVEPLDIANYYRHLKNEDTGPYLVKGRPNRYKYIQRWREHAERMAPGSSSESCFWAEVEELRTRSYEEIKDKIPAMEREVSNWVQKNEMGKDVFLEQSTFSKWWKQLYQEHRWESFLVQHMSS